MADTTKKALCLDTKGYANQVSCAHEKDIECAKCQPMRTSSKKTILACGQGSRAAFTNSNDPSTIVGSVRVDTKDTAKPTVSIQFSSVIQFLALFTAAEGRLDFELFRACDDGNPLRLNTWTYEIAGLEGSATDFDALRFTKSFNFNFCDFPACSGCCEYFVSVSVVNVSVATILVDNVHITALAQ